MHWLRGKEQRLSFPLDELKPVLTCALLQQIQDNVNKITVSEELYEYLIKIVNATRNSAKLEYGASPRGSLDLMRYSQAAALFEGRDYVLPDDIKRSAPLILGHRVIIKKGTRLTSTSNTEIIDSIVESVEVPV